MQNLAAFFLLIALLTSAWAEQQPAPPETLESAITEPYLIAPGDVLEISVWKEADLQRQALVTPDGSFSFPLVGTVHTTGRSIADIHKIIVTRLQPFITDPVVNVALMENNGNTVFVIGKVNRPGEFPMHRKIDVLQALSLAGGVTPFADTDDIKVLRRVGKKIQVFQFDYDDVVAGNDLEQNIVLQAGDTVAVP